MLLARVKQRRGESTLKPVMTRGVLIVNTHWPNSSLGGNCFGGRLPRMLLLCSANAILCSQALLRLADSMTWVLYFKSSTYFSAGLCACVSSNRVAPNTWPTHAPAYTTCSYHDKEKLRTASNFRTRIARATTKTSFKRSAHRL